MNGPPGGYKGPSPVKAPPPQREVGFLGRCCVALCCCSPCCDPFLPVSVGSNGSKSEKNQSTDGLNLDPSHVPKTNKPATNNDDRPPAKGADLPEVNDRVDPDPVNIQTQLILPVTNVPATVTTPGHQPTAVTVTTTPAPPEQEVNVLPGPIPRGAGAGVTDTGYARVAVSGVIRHNGGAGALSQDGKAMVPKVSESSV